MALHGFLKFLPNACPLKLPHLSIGSAASNKIDEIFPPNKERGGTCVPKMMLLQVINMTWVVGVIVILEMASAAILVAAAAAPLAKPNCSDHCGDVKIPFPFGTSEGCYLDHNYFINCTYNSSGKPPRPIYRNFVVQNISLKGQFELIFEYPVYECFNKSGALLYQRSYFFVNLSSSFSYTHNVFVAIGCDTIAYLNGTTNNGNFSTGCHSVCENTNDMANGSCSGIGCCQVEIPKGLGGSSLAVQSFYEHRGVWKSNNCSYAFIVKRDAFHFSTEYLIPNMSNMTFPVVFDWGIRNEKCDFASTKSDFLCGRNSTCNDSWYGYRCICNPGYEGNPYLLDGCLDINECDHPSDNNCTQPKLCINTNGSYTCSCPDGYQGDGRKDGTNCTSVHPPNDNGVPIGVVIGTTLSVGLVVSVGVSWVIKTRKICNKLTPKCCKNKGGERHSNHQGSMEVRIFRAGELAKATNNYDQSTKRGQGGDGTVYRGVLIDKKVVAIKESKIADNNQIKHFINEITQISHKNVVKLLGFCLETEEPMLVYEFIKDWPTLSDYIHDKDKSSLLSWEKRLKIATEAAGALAYLHDLEPSIIHRDVKSANILLAKNHKTKVAYLGASRPIPLDHPRLEQGTFGYLDPEYSPSGQLTEKSDVYSFGVVLAELLTGKEVISLDRAEKDKNLATYFVSALEDDRLLEEIIEDHIIKKDNFEEVKKVSYIAKRCLSIKGEDRPTMKEVKMELQGLRNKKKHSNEKADLHSEETKSSRTDLSLEAGTSNCSISTTIDSIMQFLPCCSMIPLF